MSVCSFIYSQDSVLLKTIKDGNILFLSFSLFFLFRQLIAFCIIGIDFSMFILYIKTLMNMFISHTSFLKVSLGFSIYTTILSMEINFFFSDLHSCFLFHFVFITTLAMILISNKEIKYKIFRGLTLLDKNSSKQSHVEMSGGLEQRRG